MSHHINNDVKSRCIVFFDCLATLTLWSLRGFKYLQIPGRLFFNRSGHGLKSKTATERWQQRATIGWRYILNEYEKMDFGGNGYNDRRWSDISDSRNIQGSVDGQTKCWSLVEIVFPVFVTFIKKIQNLQWAVSVFPFLRFHGGLTLSGDYLTIRTIEEDTWVHRTTSVDKMRLFWSNVSPSGHRHIWL